jgi:hypothetical protein
MPNCGFNPEGTATNKRFLSLLRRSAQRTVHPLSNADLSSRLRLLTDDEGGRGVRPSPLPFFSRSRKGTYGMSAPRASDCAPLSKESSCGGDLGRSSLPFSSVSSASETSVSSGGRLNLSMTSSGEHGSDVRFALALLSLSRRGTYCSSFHNAEVSASSDG